MRKITFSLIIITLLFISFFLSRIKISSAAPNVCGNGVCQASQSENCNTCPQDCGTCPTPPPTPPPTPGPTPTSPPGPTPTLPPGETSPPSPEQPSGGGQPSESTTDPNTVPTISLGTVPEYINTSTISLSGSSNVASGNITGVEFSYDNGTTWLSATATDGAFNSNSESFNLTTPSLPDGSYTILVRAQSSAGKYTTVDSTPAVTVTIITQPPEANITTDLSQPTSDLTPTISGNLAGFAISAVQISFDGGNSWFNIPFSGKRFSFTPRQELEDGNYKIVIRIFDKAGNVTVSEGGELVVDTIPPIIGGNTIALGSLNLKTDSLGVVNTAIGASNLMTLSTKGGATKVLASTDAGEFEFEKIPLTDLWRGSVIFSSSGLKAVQIYAEDGAGNSKTRIVNEFHVVETGIVYDQENNSPLAGVEVKVYLRPENDHRWYLWQAEAFGQNNPTKTNDQGQYSFALPKGTYYLEIKHPGYKTTRSQIFNITNTTVANTKLPLQPLAHWNIKLPWGDFKLTLPSLTPPNSVAAEIIPDYETAAGAEDFLGQKITTFYPNLSDYIGNPFDVVFLASWSDSSSDQAKVISQINDQVVAIFPQENIHLSQSFIRRGNYQFDFLADKTGEAAENLNVNALPKHLFINSQGIIENYSVGLLPKEKILESLSKLK